MDNHVMKNLDALYHENIDKGDVDTYSNLYGGVEVDLTKTLTGGFNDIDTEEAETKRYITIDGKTEVNFLLNKLTHAGDFRIIGSYFVIDGECFLISNVRRDGEVISFDYKYYDSRSYQALREKIGGTDYIFEKDFESIRILPLDKGTLKYIDNGLTLSRNVIKDLQNYVYQRKIEAPSSRAC